jgi:hypothetical protein
LDSKEPLSIDDIAHRAVEPAGVAREQKPHAFIARVRPTMLPSSPLHGTRFAPRRVEDVDVPEPTLIARVEILEQKVLLLEGLPDQVTAVEMQIVHLRGELRESVSALRADIRAGDEETRREMRVLNAPLRDELRDEMTSRLTHLERELREEIRAADEEMRQEMRLLRDELRDEIRAGDEETRRHMRVLHEEVISRLALIQEGRHRRKK